MQTATAVPSPSSKVELRAQAIARRRVYVRALSPDLRGSLEAQLAQRVLPHLSTAAVIAGYCPMKDEIDLQPILAALASMGRVTALPWFADRDALMMFRRAPAEAPGPWGVLQPPATADAVRPDVVLVPLVAADASCNRIGHGKGHYDRALANLREAGLVRTIGLAWDVQILGDLVTPDPWDIPLDAVATPDRLIACRA